MDVSAIHSPWCAHIGNDAEEFARLKLPQPFRSGLATHDRIAAAFENRTDVAHDRGLVFDEQHGQNRRFCGRCTHGFTTPATADKDANSLTDGSRTVNVAPGSPPLLVQRISPPC